MATTIVVRMILVPLTIRQIHSMQSLQKHAPQMKEIQKKYKQDRQKQNEELMKFYRENNINPAASCLPMLLQLPVFIALYYTLKHFQTELPHVPGPRDLSFLHFIPSIQAHTTTHWGGFVLLVVYVASQMASSFFMMTTTDKTQRIAVHGDAALLRLHHRALPCRPRSLLGDDEPLDGRAGADHAAARREDAARRRPSGAARGRRRRTTARAATARRPNRRRRSRLRPASQRPRQVRRKKKRTSRR